MHDAPRGAARTAAPEGRAGAPARHRAHRLLADRLCGPRAVLIATGIPQTHATLPRPDFKGTRPRSVNHCADATPAISQAPLLPQVRARRAITSFNKSPADHGGAQAARADPADCVRCSRHVRASNHNRLQVMLALSESSVKACSRRPCHGGRSPLPFPTNVCSANLPGTARAAGGGPGRHGPARAPGGAGPSRPRCHQRGRRAPTSTPERRLRGGAASPRPLRARGGAGHVTTERWPGRAATSPMNRVCIGNCARTAVGARRSACDACALPGRASPAGGWNHAARAPARWVRRRDRATSPAEHGPHGGRRPARHVALARWPPHHGHARHGGAAARWR